MNVKTHGEEILNEKREEYRDYLKLVKTQIEKLNKKFDYNPINDSFGHKKKPH